MDSLQPASNFLISTLIELQRLKRLERTGWSLRNMPAGTESVASHSFGVGITAMLLADELIKGGANLNIEEVLRISLLHDWAEVRVGDMPRTGTKYFGSDTRRAAESAALSDMVQHLNNGDLYRSLHEAYEERGTPESRLVKAADVIDLLVQVLALERAGARGLDEFWLVARSPDFQLDGAAQVLVTDILNALLEERQKLGLTL